VRVLYGREIQSINELLRATDFIPSALSAESGLLGAAKELGFSLKEIKEPVQLRRNSSSTCEDIREKGEAKIANIEETAEKPHRVARVRR
jgi:hypothetical protein